MNDTGTQIMERATSLLSELETLVIEFYPEIKEKNADILDDINDLLQEKYKE